MVEVSESKTRSVPDTSEEIVAEVYRGLRLCGLLREDTKVQVLVSKRMESTLFVVFLAPLTCCISRMHILSLLRISSPPPLFNFLQTLVHAYTSPSVLCSIRLQFSLFAPDIFFVCVSVCPYFGVFFFVCVRMYFFEKMCVRNFPPLCPVQIVSEWYDRIEYGYPVPFLNRDELVKKVDEALLPLNVYSRGRFGAWKYEVANQDHSCMQGVEAVDHMLFGTEETTYRYPSVVNSHQGLGRRPINKGRGAEASSSSSSSSQ